MPKLVRNFNSDLLQTFSLTMQDKLNDQNAISQAISIIVRAIPKIGEMLYREYQKEVIVIFDEYDVPLQKAVAARTPYYDEMLDIIRTLCANIFKRDNQPWLYKGIVTGCLRIAHQCVFTDANNFTTYGMNREPYTGFFGFTREETEKLLEDSGLSDKEDKVREWYDGLAKFLFILLTRTKISFIRFSFLSSSLTPELLTPKPTARSHICYNEDSKDLRTKLYVREYSYTT